MLATAVKPSSRNDHHGSEESVHSTGRRRAPLAELRVHRSSVFFEIYSNLITLLPASTTQFKPGTIAYVSAGVGAENKKEKYRSL